jgi:Tfp pilus assembly protein PilE
MLFKKIKIYKESGFGKCPWSEGATHPQQSVWKLACARARRRQTANALLLYQPTAFEVQHCKQLIFNLIASQAVEISIADPAKNSDEPYRAPVADNSHLKSSNLTACPKLKHRQRAHCGVFQYKERDRPGRIKAPEQPGKELNP